MEGNVFPIAEGDICVLDKHHRHFLRATRMILASIFNPPLEGTELHRLDGGGASAY